MCFNAVRLDASHCTPQSLLSAGFTAVVCACPAECRWFRIINSSSRSWCCRILLFPHRPCPRARSLILRALPLLCLIAPRAQCVAHHDRAFQSPSSRASHRCDFVVVGLRTLRQALGGCERRWTRDVDARSSEQRDQQRQCCAALLWGERQPVGEHTGYRCRQGKEFNGCQEGSGVSVRATARQ